jgi:hypothetical protein
VVAQEIADLLRSREITWFIAMGHVDDPQLDAWPRVAVADVAAGGPNPGLANAAKRSTGWLPAGVMRISSLDVQGLGDLLRRLDA